MFYGVYPGNGWFACDIRLVPGMTLDSVTADIQRFLDDAMEANPRLQAELIIEGGIEATEIPFDHPVVSALQHASSVVLGKELRPAIFPGPTDANAFQSTAGDSLRGGLRSRIPAPGPLTQRALGRHRRVRGFPDLRSGRAEVSHRVAT